MRGPIVRWITSIVAASLGILACRQIVGIGDTPPGGTATVDAGGDGGAGGVCGLPYEGACGTCLQASCCTQAAACAGSPSCMPFASCAAACGGDPECRSNCTVSAPLPSSSTELAELSACLVTSCETRCGLTCGGLEYTSPPAAAAACQTCIAGSSELCSFATACGSLTDCHALAECFVACQGRLDCREACIAAHDAGAAALAPVLEDVFASCDNACAFGGDWQCVGRVAEPYPTATTSSTVSVQIVDASNKPLSDVEVSFCDEGVCPPGATTAADGTLQLGVPLVTDVPGPRGYLYLRSPGDAGATAVVPTLYYWGFPLSEPQVTFALPPPDAGASLAYAEIQMLAPEDLDALAGEVSVMLDPQRGQLAVFIVDCLGGGASGMQAESPEADAESGRYYGRGASGSFTLSKDATTTDASGTVVFTNMPAGSVDVSASLPGQSPYSRATVLIQPGAITSVLLAPTP